MNKFNLLHHELVYSVEQHTYILQHDSGKLFYKEWVDEKGNIMDCKICDNEGNEMREYALLESAQEFIHQLNTTTK